MVEAYKSMKLNVEIIWLDFQFSFRPEFIKLWSRPIMTIFLDFLTQRDDQIDGTEKKARDTAIKDLLNSKIPEPTKTTQKELVKARDEKNVIDCEYSELQKQ